MSQTAIENKYRFAYSYHEHCRRKHNLPMKNYRLLSGMLAVSILGAASGAKATLTGSLWEYGNTQPDATSTPTGPANVTFTVPNGNLNFWGNDGDPNGDYTIGGFLASGGATILTGSGEAGNTIDNTIMIFQGFLSVNHGQQFSDVQDDGLVLTIDGLTVLNNPGPNAPTGFSGTYSGPSGDVPFMLEYSEVAGGQAQLKIDLTPVPEPSTIIAGGLLLLPLGLGILRTWRKSANATA
jgi:hypothetical protein